MENPFENKILGIKIKVEERRNIKNIMLFLRSFGYTWSNTKSIVPQFLVSTNDIIIIYIGRSKYLLYSTMKGHILRERTELLLSYEDILMLMEKCNYEIPN